MSEVRILKTDSRGRITLPPPFRKEVLFEYVIEGQQLTLYPLKTVRKFPEMSDLPVAELSAEWVKEETDVNRDKRPGVTAATPAEALKTWIPGQARNDVKPILPENHVNPR